jgi:sulfoxide reductase heme-binding subunit YedZ
MTALSVLATTGFASNPLWYATRSSGLAAFVMLTLSVVLGVLTTQRIATGWWPRFASQALHRNVSLLAVVLLVTHVLTTLLDNYVAISWWAGVIPFASTYDRVWIGLGTLALDLILVVTLSSLVRLAVGHRSWRLLHWLSYAAWPLAMTHYLSSGTDALASWSLAIAAVSTVAVVGAVFVRIIVERDERPTAVVGQR